MLSDCMHAQCSQHRHHTVHDSSTQTDGISCTDAPYAIMHHLMRAGALRAEDHINDITQASAPPPPPQPHSKQQRMARAAAITTCPSRTAHCAAAVDTYQRTKLIVKITKVRLSHLNCACHHYFGVHANIVATTVVPYTKKVRHLPCTSSVETLSPCPSIKSAHRRIPALLLLQHTEYPCSLSLFSSSEQFDKDR